MSHPQVAWTERGAGPPLLLIHGVMITGAIFVPMIWAQPAAFVAAVAAFLARR